MVAGHISTNGLSLATGRQKGAQVESRGFRQQPKCTWPPSCASLGACNDWLHFENKRTARFGGSWIQVTKDRWKTIVTKTSNKIREGKIPPRSNKQRDMVVKTRRRQRAGVSLHGDLCYDSWSFSHLGYKIVGALVTWAIYSPGD